MPLRRMVIFVHKSRKIILVTSKSRLFVIPSPPDNLDLVDRNWHEDNKQQAGEPTQFLHFNPRNPARDPSFVATTLLPVKPEDPTSFAGIPLCPIILRNIEHQNRFECNSMGLTFRNSESRKTCSETWRVMWREWHAQTKAAERQPGYTPVPPPLQRAPLPALLESKVTPKSHFRNPIRTVSSSIMKTSGSGSREDAIRPAPHRGGGRGGSRGPLKTGEAAS